MSVTRLLWMGFTETVTFKESCEVEWGGDAVWGENAEQGRSGTALSGAWCV